MERAAVVTLLVISSAFSFPSRTVNREREDISKSEPNKPVSNAKGFIRTQRNLIQFHNMIGCGTNRTSAYYVDYGCYCGYGGGGEPVDETDICCKTHDECYEAVNKADLCFFESAIYWKSYKRDNTCTGCADPEGTCERAICECDGAAVSCFAQAEYNEDNFDYPQHKC
ncbi:basic phospholipase A2 homolog 1-like [Montipora foliosa]|uniref:basic phospholipase A2 homolog 1-like n=1 Tax=Montipora foliosa TaxID=591990 RepID=UPI0035F16AA4